MIQISEEKSTLKLRSGSYRYPVTTWKDNGHLYFQFAYNQKLKDEIKAFEGARWEPDRKLWYAKDSGRNRFQLAYLAGLNPYERYDKPLDLSNIPTKRYNKREGQEKDFYQHQIEGIAHILQRRGCIVGADMGTGKSLMMGISLIMEDTDDCWYVGPRSALAAVPRDFDIWGIHPQPKKWLTYEAMTKEMKNWTIGCKAPRIVFFDEASKLKNPTAQRTQAARALADGIRQDWGDHGIIALLSGTPAPKSPADWWSLAEIACPGFLKEGDIHKFKRRLGIIIQKEGIDGGSYPQLVTWRDDSKRCDICGQFKEHENHLTELEGVAEVHEFKESVNEVAKLYERLKGLTVIYFKKYCLDLPDKIYRIIEVKPKQSTLRAASLIAKTSRTTIQGLTLLRELSDGFQYIDTPVGKVTCTLCKGEKEIDHPEEVPNSCPNCPKKEETIRDDKYDIGITCSNHIPIITTIRISCPTCGGSGQVTSYERETKEVACPKDDALVSLLDELEDVGRIVIYGGFTGSIDRIIKICQQQGWWTIKMNEGSTRIFNPKGEEYTNLDFQSIFQDKLEEYDKVAFVAHTESGGMGLTLTASPMIVYFSNTFSAEARIQSEDRIHRIGMDKNRGATIVDIVHLPSDLKVLENLKKKRDLQALSMGDFSKILEEAEKQSERSI